MKNIDVLKLEVETDPPAGTLPNLIENPNGAKGAWGWVTPVAQTTMSVGGPIPGLVYSAATNVANFFYSDPYPVTVGNSIGAGWVVQSCKVGAGRVWYRAKIEFLNASFVLLSATTPTAYLQDSTIRTYLSSATIPASTVYARLRFDMYADNVGSNIITTDTASMTVNNAAMVTAPTAAQLSAVTRTNLVKNPSFGVNTTGWASPNNPLARSTAQFYVGTASLAIQAAGSSLQADTPSGTAGIPVTPGVSYKLSAKFRAATTPRPCGIAITWYTSSGAWLSDSFGGYATNNTTGWVDNTSSPSAPAGAAYAQISVYADLGVTAPNGETHYVDAVSMERDATYTGYFDGDTTDTAQMVYAWTGTAHNSTSTLTEYAPYSDGTWTDILGPTHEIKVAREDLNVGLLTATILDASLDPATATLIRPGRQVRLRALDATTSTYASLFEGQVTDADVAYDLRRKDAKQARISLVAADSIRTLSNVSRKEGVEKISDLRYLAEGAGVPWTINRDSNQAPTAVVVAKNENASLLDQISVTRDSALGYAWVSRNNVLVANDADLMPTGPASMAVYEDFEDSTLNLSITGTWARSSASAYLSSWSLKSATIAASATTDAVVAVPAGAATVTFRYRVSSEAGFDFFRFLVGAVVQYSDSGLAGTWVQKTFNVTGASTITFRYTKDTSTNAGEDAAYVDNISFNGPTPVLDESVYSDLDVSFNSNTCINDVRIKWLRYTPSTGTTEEVVYGPYRAAASVQTWGYHSAEFTAQGAVENASSIAAYANKILAANGTPVVRINSVQIPINKAADVVPSKALLDLYDLARLKNTAKALDHTSRITGIDHEITSDRWLMQVYFSTEGSVASPQLTPSPATGATDTVKLDGSVIATGTVADARLPVILAGKRLGAAGSIVNGMQFGQATGVTINASGQVVISHGLGVTPTTIIATGSLHVFRVQAQSPTNFTLVCYALPGAAIATGGTTTVFWMALT